MLANVGSVAGGRTIAPNGIVSSYLSGIPTFWNETIAGYTHRLPTNRENAYPKPGAQQLIAQGLQSYDCSNLHNPLLVPAFGGVPPCVQQGPWTFEGRTAYFPHLQPAAPARGLGR